jgi:hypothetical protein
MNEEFVETQCYRDLGSVTGFARLPAAFILCVMFASPGCVTNLWICDGYLRP